MSLTLRAEADTLTPDEMSKRLDALKLMAQVYRESSQAPTWPFDTSIIVKLVAAEAVPILSLMGVSATLIQLVESLTSLLPR